MKPSIRQSLTRFLPGYALLAALLFMPGTGNASSFLSNRFRHYRPPTAEVAGQGSVVAATVTRVGSDFQISWTIEGAVDSVKIQEGPSPEQIENLVAEVSGVAVKTVTGLDPNQRHYFRVRAEVVTES